MKMHLFGIVALVAIAVTSASPTRGDNEEEILDSLDDLLRELKKINRDIPPPPKDTKSGRHSGSARAQGSPEAELDLTARGEVPPKAQRQLNEGGKYSSFGADTPPKSQKTGSSQSRPGVQILDHLKSLLEELERYDASDNTQGYIESVEPGATQLSVKLRGDIGQSCPQCKFRIVYWAEKDPSVLFAYPEKREAAVTDPEFHGDGSVILSTAVEPDTLYSVTTIVYDGKREPVIDASKRYRTKTRARVARLSLGGTASSRRRR